MKDYDFIKNKFDNDNIAPPSSLSEENAFEMISTGAVPKNTIKLQSKASKGFKIAVSMVACLAVLVASLFGVNAMNSRQAVKTEPQSAELQSFASYDEVNSCVEDLFKKYNSANRPGMNHGFFFDKNISTAETATVDSVDNTNHSTTNLQVEGVDEADIVKTDGKYIYRINQDSTAVKIFKVDGENVEKTGFANLKDNHEYQYVIDMYLCGDKLVVISECDDYKVKSLEHINCTIVTVFDVTDKANPKIESTYEQSGSYVSTRMIGDVVYIVSEFYAQKGNYIPKANNSFLPCDCITSVPSPDTPQFVVVGAFDANSGESSRSKTKAILGGGSKVFCSQNNLYITSVGFNWKNFTYDESTSVIKVAFDKLDLRVVATGKFKGVLNDEYSMNEKNDCFLVASTLKNKSDRNVNTLYVFDKNLKQISKVENFARDETIQAVRYIGDYAYVITYEQTDPLFVIDLSDVKNPVIKGSVKIDGFSTSLMPIDENTLLGVGFSVDEQMTNGVKFALFDISNPEKPKVLDEYELPDSYSSAQDTIKAITMVDENTFAIPLSCYTVFCYDGYTEQVMEDEHGGILLMSIKDGKFVLDKRYKHELQMDRVVRINNYLYGSTSWNAYVIPFEMPN